MLNGVIGVQKLRRSGHHHSHSHTHSHSHGHPHLHLPGHSHSHSRPHSDHQEAINQRTMSSGEQQHTMSGGGSDANTHDGTTLRNDYEYASRHTTHIWAEGTGHAAVVNAEQHRRLAQASSVAAAAEAASGGQGLARPENYKASEGSGKFGGASAPCLDLCRWVCGGTGSWQAGRIWLAAGTCSASQEVLVPLAALMLTLSVTP